MTMPADDLENGILSVQHLEQAIADGVIAADQPIEPGQLQPASLDLRLGREAWRVQASFLPGKNLTVADKLAKFGMHKIDLSDGAVLERGCVYIVKLMENLRLPAGVSAMANPKS
ncbi:MAG: 2'-deoxycytidine 5'-triphosphate deaminase, partial [Alphaproteobacteria bacterium]|nr:2'-deoxycytidine 5'-triphosphate deaminase [Alphaproteobacteria bacterium]NDA19267.1 2'-deoxycytidine 5'-triphosphate deaminase [Alphaproteobacteria bacterium]NDG37655.1 2'-deoxycytidine 5'-triphosphate deaminase [Alphaproteobacteria bacterium]